MNRQYYCQGCKNEEDCPDEIIEESITHDCYESDELDYLTHIAIQKFMYGRNLE